MRTIACLTAVAGFLVLVSCTRVEAPRVSSPGVPSQEPAHAAQAPVSYLDSLLHVGAAASPRTDALPRTVSHGSASVHHGELPNAVTRAELLAYLHEDARSQVPAGGETGSDDQLFPDGLLLRFAADPPLVRVAEGTPPELVDEAVRVVQLLNMALPARDWQIGFGNEPGAPGTADPASSEIIITFAAQEDWPDELRPPEGPPEGGSIGLAVPLFEIYATGDPERPWNLQITGGRIWIDPTRTEGDERLGVIAHELIHMLGRAHPDPIRFPDTLMVAGGGDGPTLHILHPLDRAALFAVYSRVEPGGTPGAIEIDFGPWADTSTHLYGVLGLADGEVAFGAAVSNGLVQPWGTGPGPGSELGENPHLAGTARWSGRLLGFTPAAEAVAGAAELAVRLESLDGDSHVLCLGALAGRHRTGRPRHGLHVAGRRSRLPHRGARQHLCPDRGRSRHRDRRILRTCARGHGRRHRARRSLGRVRRPPLSPSVSAMRTLAIALVQARVTRGRASLATTSGSGAERS